MGKRWYRRMLAALAVSVGALVGMNTQSSAEVPVGMDTQSSADELSGSVEKILANLSLEQKVGQMMIITPDQATGGNDVTIYDTALQEAYGELPVGGYIYMGANLTNPQQTVAMLTASQEFALSTTGIPLFQAVDEEGGRVARIGRNHAFGTVQVPAMLDVVNGAPGQEELAVYANSMAIGSYLDALGFNVDFAPDADVITEPENSVIGDRSFGSDPNLVMRCSAAYMKGLHNSGIMACFKHFPGHGGTVSDSHEGFACNNSTLEELIADELPPFIAGSHIGVDFIMVGHISFPNILGDNTPATLSHYMVTELLRGTLGYQGIIITDAMNMGAITEYYTQEEAAVLAVKAGCDILLMPEDPQVAYQAVITAVRTGEIPMEQIDASVRRILTAKLEM